MLKRQSDLIIWVASFYQNHFYPFLTKLYCHLLHCKLYQNNLTDSKTFCSLVHWFGPQASLAAQHGLSWNWVLQLKSKRASVTAKLGEEAPRRLKLICWVGRPTASWTRLNKMAIQVIFSMAFWNCNASWMKTSKVSTSNFDIKHWYDQFSFHVVSKAVRSDVRRWISRAANKAFGDQVKLANLATAKVCGFISTNRQESEDPKMPSVGQLCCRMKPCGLWNHHIDFDPATHGVVEPFVPSSIFVPAMPAPPHVTSFDGPGRA